MRLKYSLFLSFLMASVACAQPLDLVLRGPKDRAQHLLYVRFGSEPVDSLAENYCTTIAQVFSFRSQHPGYGNRVNQNNKGYGFKCRIGAQDPTFVHLGGLTNSQWGSTFVGGIGKQIDLLFFEGPFGTKIRYYIGAELDAISYEWPARRITYYGIAPLWHQGVAVHLPGNGKFSGLIGVIGMEQQHLPVDHILMYQGYFRIIKRW